MAIYETTEQAQEIFGRLFEILVADEGFSSAMRANGMTVRLVHTKPDCLIYVSADELRFGEDVPEQATVTIKMSCDTAHQLWLGNLMVPTAVATGKVRIRGKVAKVIQLVPILQPAFDRYAEIFEASSAPATV